MPPSRPLLTLFATLFALCFAPAWVALFGCADAYRIGDILIHDPADRTAVVTQPDPTGAPRINPYRYAPEHADDRGRLPEGRASLYQTAVAGQDTENARRARNRLQNAVLAVSDRAAAQHWAGVKAAEAGSNLALGVAQIGLSGVASVATAGSSQALSAGAAGLGGTRATLSQALYRDRFGELIIESMRLDRRRFLAEVVEPRQQLDVARYDVDAALRDAERYHQLGSFYHGLGLVLQNAGGANLNTQARLQSVESENFVARLSPTERLKHRLRRVLDAPPTPAVAERFGSNDALANALARSIQDDSGATWFALQAEGGDALAELIAAMESAQTDLPGVVERYRLSDNYTH
ncbi:MAG: hypothetical protein AAF288_08165 [Planctomycetota bacterium]